MNSALRLAERCGTGEIDRTFNVFSARILEANGRLAVEEWVGHIGLKLAFWKEKLDTAPLQHGRWIIHRHLLK